METVKRTILLLACGLSPVFFSGQAAGDEEPSRKPARSQWRERLAPVLDAKCSECHAGDDASGGLELTSLPSDLSDAETMRRWVLIYDRVALGEMPPQDAPQLAPKERSEILQQIGAALDSAHRAQRDVVLRRLNRREYENTVRDLFGVHVRVQELLPEDTSTAGFDNVGEGLALSAEAARAYLRAADVTLDAVFGPLKKPKYIQHKTNLLDQKTHDGKPFLSKQFGKMFRRTKNGIVIFQSGYCPTNLVNFGRLRPPAGVYRGRIQVRAVQSKQPVTLRIYGGDTVVGRGEKHLVGYYDIPPGDWTTIEFEDRLVENGGTFQPKCYGTRDTRKNADTYPEPGLEIGDIFIEGPLGEWPPASRVRLLAGVDPVQGDIEDARRILTTVAAKAFRRPIERGELADYLALVQKALDESRPFQQALRLGLKGILCSPDFLFLDEPGVDAISQTAMASRLSYFLWKSLPDDRLRELAADGQLLKSAVLREQVERLLNDDKSDRFVTEFIGQWLSQRDIDFTSPDANLYPEFDELLQISMLRETHLFFRELLDRDLNLMNLVDSDFVIINERLAKHYAIDGVRGQEFRRVKLGPDRVRGGVLAQASVLKVTANGSNTSPVVRGVWVMDKLLGWTAPPPPSDVAAVEPDIRGATTLREQLAKHRTQESCAVCHHKIDPAGFALENFDAIGGWRENYRTLGEGKRPSFSQHPITFAWVRYRIGLPVDATGKTAIGKPFSDIREFKQLLMQQDRLVAQNLTKKLLTFALGRRLGFSDRPHVEKIVDRASQHGFRLRALLHAIVQSPLFRSP